MKTRFSLLLGASVLVASLCMMSLPTAAAAAVQGASQGQPSAAKAKHASKAKKSKHAKKTKKSKKAKPAKPQHAAPRK